ncbi:MAG: hypothetical protein WCD81_11020 [Candidatus Bathyarchaeia archaeon]
MFKKIIEEKTRFDGIEFCKVDLEYRVKPSGRRADLVVFIKNGVGEEKAFLVIEVKRSREHEDETDYSQKFPFPGLGEITLQEAMDKGLLDKGSYKYHMGALQQAREYAQSIGAPFFAVCYGDSLFIRSFREQYGKFYKCRDLSEEFVKKLLNELAQLYGIVKSTQQ